MTPDDPVRSAVGHDASRLVLQFERVLRHAPEEVWRALNSSKHHEHWTPCGIRDARREGTSVPPSFLPIDVDASRGAEPVVTGTTQVWQAPRVLEWTSGADAVRWEVNRVGQDTRLALTIWIDNDDVEAVAKAGASYHVCFNQLVELLDTGSVSPPLPCEELATLAGRYSSEVAAALADTD